MEYYCRGGKVVDGYRIYPDTLKSYGGGLCSGLTCLLSRGGEQPLRSVDVRPHLCQLRASEASVRAESTDVINKEESFRLSPSNNLS